jgi:hypothetical protein
LDEKMLVSIGVGDSQNSGARTMQNLGGQNLTQPVADQRFYGNPMSFCVCLFMMHPCIAGGVWPIDPGRFDPVPAPTTLPVCSLSVPGNALG